MRTFGPRTLGSTRLGGRQRKGILGIKSSVRQRSARSSPPRRSARNIGVRPSLCTFLPVLCSWLSPRWFASDYFEYAVKTLQAKLAVNDTCVLNDALVSGILGFLVPAHVTFSWVRVCFFCAAVSTLFHCWSQTQPWIGIFLRQTYSWVFVCLALNYGIELRITNSQVKLRLHISECTVLGSDRRSEPNPNSNPNPNPNPSRSEPIIILSE